MLSSRSSAVLRQSARLATQRHASTLVLAEHDNNKLSPVMITTSAVAEDDPSISQSVFTITEKTPSRAFSWLKVPTGTFTIKTLLRHSAIRTMLNNPPIPYDFCFSGPISCLLTMGSTPV